MVCENQFVIACNNVFDWSVRHSPRVSGVDSASVDFELFFRGAAPKYQANVRSHNICEMIFYS